MKNKTDTKIHLKVFLNFSIKIILIFSIHSLYLLPSPPHMHMVLNMYAFHFERRKEALRNPRNRFVFQLSLTGCVTQGKAHRFTKLHTYHVESNCPYYLREYRNKKYHVENTAALYSIILLCSPKDTFIDF